MFQDDFKEGNPIILQWDTDQGTFLFKSYVLIKEGSLVGLAPVYDDQEKFVDFKTGTVSITTRDGSSVYDNVVIRPVIHKGSHLYLTYGRKEKKEITYTRKYPRFPVHKECLLNGRPAKLFDVSDGGFGVIVQREYKVGVWTQLQKGRSKAYGKIVHVKPIGANTWFYGCQVDDPDDSFVRLVKEARIVYEESMDDKPKK